MPVSEVILRTDYDGVLNASNLDKVFLLNNYPMRPVGCRIVREKSDKKSNIFDME